jgi:hypothetical protein
MKARAKRAFLCLKFLRRTRTEKWGQQRVALSGVETSSL